MTCFWPCVCPMGTGKVQCVLKVSAQQQIKKSVFWLSNWAWSLSTTWGLFAVTVNDFVYMGCKNPTIDLILKVTVCRFRYLHELLIEYSLHIPVYMLQNIVWLMTHETHAHLTSYTFSVLAGPDLKLEVKQQHNSKTCCYCFAKWLHLTTGIQEPPLNPRYTASMKKRRSWGGLRRLCSSYTLDFTQPSCYQGNTALYFGKHWNFNRVLLLWILCC